MNIYIHQTRACGMEVFKIYIDGVYLAQALSEQGARTIAVKYFNKRMKG